MGKLIPNDSLHHKSLVHRVMKDIVEDLQEFNNFFHRNFNGMLSDISMDLVDNGREYVVTANLPGIDAKNVDIYLDDYSLTIKGAHVSDTTNQDTKYILQERWVGSFSRSISFHDPIIPEKAKASVKDGVLHITAPKSTDKKEKFVKINIE